MKWIGMKRPFGVSLEIALNAQGWPSILFYRQKLGRLRAKTPDDAGNWFAEDKLVMFSYFGLKLDITFGTLRRPIRKFWTKDNPWTSGNYWFILNVPFFLGAFLSCGLGSRNKTPGFYVGTKTYIINRTDGHMSWADEDELGNIYLAPSASLRKDLV